MAPPEAACTAHGVAMTPGKQTSEFKVTVAMTAVGVVMVGGGVAALLAGYEWGDKLITIGGGLAGLSTSSYTAVRGWVKRSKP